MTTLQDREQEFENRFKHDQEIDFKIAARRNRMLGLWAAERLGLEGAAAAGYASDVVDSALPGGTNKVVAKVVADLSAAGDGVTSARVRFELDHFAVIARRQVMAE